MTIPNCIRHKNCMVLDRKKLVAPQGAGVNDCIRLAISHCSLDISRDQRKTHFGRPLSMTTSAESN